MTWPESLRDGLITVSERAIYMIGCRLQLHASASLFWQTKPFIGVYEMMVLDPYLAAVCSRNLTSIISNGKQALHE